MRNILSLTLVLLMAAQSALAGECSARTGEKTTALIELYTSEGCDSCPPADKWLNSLDVDASRAVPLALHVDYWDYIGWKDPYGNPDYSARQRETVRLAGGRAVYTPQVMMSGRDARSWGRESEFRAALEAVNAKPPRADISLRAVWVSSGIRLEVASEMRDRAFASENALFIALTENNLVSAVKAGENRGVTLRHDHVVRELRGLQRFDATGIQRAVETFTLKPEWKTKDLSAVAFVQNRRTGEIVQALKLPLCAG
jgi:hypothetical protein